MKKHPTREILKSLCNESAGLRTQVAAVNPGDPTALRVMLERVTTSHLALLAVVEGLAADLYPYGVPAQPGER